MIVHKGEFPRISDQVICVNTAAIGTGLGGIYPRSWQQKLAFMCQEGKEAECQNC